MQWSWVSSIHVWWMWYPQARHFLPSMMSSRQIVQHDFFLVYGTQSCGCTTNNFSIAQNDGGKVCRHTVGIQVEVVSTRFSAFETTRRTSAGN